MAAFTTIVALAGCRPVIPEPAVEDAPEAPLFTDPACLPTSLASRSPQHRLTDVPGTPPSGSPRLGAAVDVVQFGPLQAQAPGYGPDLFSEVLVGVPHAPLGHGGSGLVRWVTLNRTTGQLADPDRYPATEILGPSGADEFGGAVMAADVVGPYSTPAFNPVLRGAQGQEVVVGAPTASGGGRVYVYQASYAIADVGSVDDRTVWPWQPFTALSAPAGAGSKFGASLAVDRRLDPGDQAPYFAVGAPGVNAVYIYSVDTSTSPPTGMTLVQTLTPGGLGAGFTAVDYGFAVVIDDFDRDGFADLAIGAPGDSQAPPRVLHRRRRASRLPGDGELPLFHRLVPRLWVLRDPQPRRAHHRRRADQLQRRLRHRRRGDRPDRCAHHVRRRRCGARQPDPDRRQLRQQRPRRRRADCDLQPDRDVVQRRLARHPAGGRVRHRPSAGAPRLLHPEQPVHLHALQRLGGDMRVAIVVGLLAGAACGPGGSSGQPGRGPTLPTQGQWGVVEFSGTGQYHVPLVP
jgi:hypothetical protein